MISCFKGSFKVTSPRGYRTLSGIKEYHGGIDVVALGNDKSVYAVADGVVDATPYEANGFGYYVRQLLPDGRRIYYGHMKKGSITVKAGQSIKCGDKLGVMGATGKVTGTHTHIELRVKGTSKESLDICDFTGIPNKCGTYTTNIDNADEIISELKSNRFGVEINDVNRAVKALEKAKINDDINSLYWILWKLVNNNGK